MRIVKDSVQHMVYGYISLEEVCTYLCLGLFSYEYHVSGCVVYRYIGQVDPVPDQLIQFLHGRGPHEQDGTRLWEVNHLTYQMHTL